ncbi:hypothetical protein GGR51DRAFT_563203 [Nemania sp. FL0031]|nr:hypothetical protein GGR51DRAFT_563203 [Nemania sp. FL0031]
MEEGAPSTKPEPDTSAGTRPVTEAGDPKSAARPTNLDTVVNLEPSRDRETGLWKSLSSINEDGSFRWAVLLARYNNQEFDCRVWVNNYYSDKMMRFRLLLGCLTLDPSQEPTNQLRKYDVNNLALVDAEALSDSRPPMDGSAPQQQRLT